MSNINWTASSNASWLTVIPSSGSNNGTLYVTAAANTANNSRTATVTVSGTNIASYLTVRQASPTDNAIVEAVSVTYFNNVLTVNTPQTEQVSLYALSGMLVYRANKDTGKATFDLSKLPDGVYIVTGESGWKKKIIKN
jgi:hypothetical protein